MPPNILLVVFDTARADSLEPYAGGAAGTPAVADLARRGFAARGVWATANWTVPSHGSMFTGLLPGALDFRSAPHPRQALLRHSERLLPVALGRAGYSTNAVSANAMVSRAFGFDAGFDRFEVVRSRRRHAGAGLAGRARWSLEAVRARLDDGLAQSEDVVRRWIADRPARPFFWFVNLMECHSPYLPPRPWNDLGALGRFRGGQDARRYQSLDGVVRVCLGETDVPPASIERMRHLYARSVAAMDAWLGRVLGELDGRGLLDDTIVIVTSDHGENLGEDHLIGHANFSMDERLLRVPFVAAGPGLAQPGGPVWSLADLPRYLAEAAGIAGHPWGPAPRPGAAAAESEGYAALSPAVARNLVERWNVRPRAQEAMFVRRRAVTDGRFKLVVDGDATRLRDLESDPEEREDASARYPAEVERLRRLLDELVASNADPLAAVGAPRAAPEPDVPDAPASEAEQRDLEERLKLLGYL